jgi:hypothetical protein
LYVFGGVESGVDVGAQGNSKPKRKAQRLPLPASCSFSRHDNFADVIARLKPEQLEAAFIFWVEAAMQVTEATDRHPALSGHLRSCSIAAQMWKSNCYLTRNIVALGKA